MTSASFRRFPAPRAWEMIDGVLDGGVVAFAVWTLWYQVALATQLDLRPSALPMVALTLALAVVGGWYRRRCSLRPAPGSRSGPGAVRIGRGIALTRRRGLLYAAGVGLLALAVVLRGQIGVLPLVLVALALLVVVGWHRLGSPVAPTYAGADSLHDEAGVSGLEHLGAALVSLGLGILALFLSRTDADDVFYVNRATWIAEHGTAALNDTVFGANTGERAAGNGLPTPSIEALQGVLAHLLGVQAATFAYLLFVPVLACAFGWATWRLVRAWAPRRAFLVFLIAVVFVLASGTSVLGSYSIGRIWQGKVTAFAVLLPLVWCYLTRASVRLGRVEWVLLIAAGITFVGLTATSTLMAPVICGAVVVLGLLTRRPGLVWGGLAFVAAPLINGVVQILAPQEVGDGVTHAGSLAGIFAIAFGSQLPLVLLGVLGVVLAVTVVHRRELPVVLAAGLAAFVVYLPGVVPIADAATGAGPVVWRLAITAPLAVLVGLLASVDLSRARVPSALATRRMALAWGVVLIAVPAVAGTWLWDSKVGGSLSSSPSWKVAPEPLANLRAAQRLQVPEGRWLLPPVEMEDLAISEAGPYAVVPRVFYLPSLLVPETEKAERQLLVELSAGVLNPRTPTIKVREALKRLDVSLTCVPASSRPARRLLARTVQSPLRKVGTMKCHVGRL